MYPTTKPISWIIYIYIRFGTKLYRQIVGIPMGTKCAPLVADLFLCCCEEISWILLTMTIKLMLSRLFIRLLDTSMTVCANTTDAEAPFIDLHLSIANGFVSSTIYGKRDDFSSRDIGIINFEKHFLNFQIP